MKVYLESVRSDQAQGIVLVLIVVTRGDAAISMTIHSDARGTLSWTQEHFTTKPGYVKGLPVLDGNVMDSKLRAAIKQAASLPADVY